MKNLPLLLGTILGTVVLVIIVAFVFSGPAQAPVGSDPVDQQKLVAGATKAVGPEDAAITIVEFSDFQCPACKSTKPIADQVIAQHPEVRFVYRNFPLDEIHPNARLAAQAAEAAQLEGKFWGMYDLLFDGQGEWESLSEKSALLDIFAGYAEELEIDKQVFLEKIESSEVVQAVQAERTLGEEIGIQGTPTFFVNGILTPAPQLLAVVESLSPESASASAEPAAPQQ